MLGEDIEDEGGAVDDLGIDDVLQTATLGGGQFLVNDHRVSLDRTHDLSQFAGLTQPR